MKFDSALSRLFPLLSALVITAICAPTGVQAGGYDLKAAVAEAQAQGRAVVVIPPGRHLLDEGGVDLRGLRNFVIEGSGATLVAVNRRAQALRVADCDGLTIRNLFIDYDPLPFTQGDVLAVNAAERLVTVRLHRGYPGVEVLADANAFFTDARLQLFDGDSALHKYGAPDYGVEQITQVENGSLQVRLPQWQAGVEFIAVGDSVTLSSRASEGVTIRTSANVTFENVTLYAAPNVAFLVRSSEDAGTFRNVRIVPGPMPQGADRQRLISACADGLNVAFTRKGPVMENCEFSYQADDGVNLHGGLLPVLKQLDTRTYLTAMPWSGNLIHEVTRDGDAIRFLEPQTYALSGTGRVERITRVSGSVEEWLPQLREIWKVINVNPASVTFYHVVLQEPVQGARIGTFFEIPATAAPGFIFRNNYFHNHRARGLRIMAGNGLILGNRFENLKGCAISLGAEFAFWHEAGWVQNVIVANNDIRSVGTGMQITAPASYTLGAISVMARTDDGTISAYEGNRRIVIEDNRIDGCSVNGISVSNARNVSVARNRIANVNLAGAADAGRSFGLASLQAISVIRAEATLSDNTIKPD